MVRRVVWIVLDSVGIGALPDAHLYGDEGSNTLGNIAKAVGGLSLPNLEKMGLGNIAPIQGLAPALKPIAAYGKMAEQSPGKDTITGHWEMAGLILEKAFPVYTQGFPLDLIRNFEMQIGRKILGNKAASGTEIIVELGEEHIRTGYPIVYTSADSVFQIAAHEEVIPLDELYSICKIARNILIGEHRVGRVIARPFIGEVGNFKRTANRSDFSLKPPSPTILDYIVAAHYEVIGIGKIADIFARQGLSKSIPAKSNRDAIDKIIYLLGKQDTGLLFANLVDFDSIYGHRNDPLGYSKALIEFDDSLPEIYSLLGSEDVLIINADHGCDPTFPGTDHTREYVPLLIFGQKIKKGINLGVRSSFSDLGKTVAELLNVEADVDGISMLNLILTGEE